MHELFVLYSSWSGALYNLARAAVGILLWFWVISGAVFVLRFLAFMVMEKNSGSPLAAASAVTPFPIDQFKAESGVSSSQE